MDQAATDPLAALEAEYATVLAQGTLSAEDSSSIESDNAEPAGSDSEDDESTAVGGFESYALLPSSPCTSDADTPETSLSEEENAGKDEDATERLQNETNVEGTPANQKDIRLQENKRLIIMQSMQQVKLRPPPWVQAANLTDDELVDMVQKQLGLTNKAE